MRYLTLSEVLWLHRQIMERSGGIIGVLSLDVLESALAQPRITFGGLELYPSVIDKASALGYSIIKNHPFADGNKRTGHAAMEVFLVLNGFEISAPIDEQEQTTLHVAAGTMSRSEFTDWLRLRVVSRT